eukprot:3011259-Prymnesium_polylepis.2
MGGVRSVNSLPAMGVNACWVAHGNEDSKVIAYSPQRIELLRRNASNCAVSCDVSIACPCVSLECEPGS